MTSLMKSLGRRKRAKLATAAFAVAGASALLFATEFPSGMSLTGGGSAALAELMARSPGMRTGGLALKGKAVRAMALPVGSAESVPTGPGEEAGAPRNAVASVLGASAGPEEGLPGALPGPDDAFPSDFTAPAVPSVTAPAGATSPGPGGFGGFSPPSLGGGGPVILPPGPGATTPTDTVPTPGPSETPPTGTPTDTPTSTPTVAPPLPTGPVPEPQAWALLIVGFGIVGRSMRTRRRVAAA